MATIKKDKVVVASATYPLDWNAGPPPSLGWWPASCVYNSECLRWWNGKHWSAPAWKWRKYTAEKLNYIARTRAFIERPIQWQHRPATWLKRSRV